MTVFKPFEPVCTSRVFRIQLEHHHELVEIIHARILDKASSTPLRYFLACWIASKSMTESTPNIVHYAIRPGLGISSGRDNSSLRSCVHWSSSSPSSLRCLHLHRSNKSLCCPRSMSLSSMPQFFRHAHNETAKLDLGQLPLVGSRRLYGGISLRNTLHDFVFFYSLRLRIR